MPESVETSINAMQAAFKKIPREAAEKLAAEAASRAEAVADYIEMEIGKKEKKEA